MHYSQLLRVLLSAALALHATTVTASPIRDPDVEGGVGASALGKRATIELYHVTTAASAASIHSGGVKLQVKPTIGDDFNPKGKGGFYVSDNKAGILDWCKKRQINAADVKTNCADLITFKFDESALTSLKVHKFGPATLTSATVNSWMDTPDFEQWMEGDEDVKLDADLENGGNGLDLVIGPMVGTEVQPDRTRRFRAQNDVYVMPGSFRKETKGLRLFKRMMVLEGGVGGILLGYAFGGVCIIIHPPLEARVVFTIGIMVVSVIAIMLSAFIPPLTRFKHPLLRGWGECPDEKWDSYLAEYAVYLPNDVKRAGSYRPFESVWERVFPIDDAELGLDLDAKWSSSPAPGKLGKFDSISLFTNSVYEPLPPVFYSRTGVVRHLRDPYLLHRLGSERRRWSNFDELSSSDEDDSDHEKERARIRAVRRRTHPKIRSTSPSLSDTDDALFGPPDFSDFEDNGDKDRTVDEKDIVSGATGSMSSTPQWMNI
ncbi:hypothetical protein EV368DRAFT_68500 [Lentinula lateritia]|nr:hypothetical protein EV368DRAFT_68500 [Lentinula lateritia]